MSGFVSDTLWHYTGIRVDHLEALRDPEKASPAMRRALRDGGLLDEAGGLTPAGRFALERAEEILAGRFREPAPLVEASWEEIRGVGRRLPDAKCLHYIARHPGLALRFLRQTFGNAPLERLRDRGWIRIPEDLPWKAWSTPVEPTKEGLRRLREALGLLTEREREGWVFERTESGRWLLICNECGLAYGFLRDNEEFETQEDAVLLAKMMGWIDGTCLDCYYRGEVEIPPI
jgi:hypothetical protein